MLILLLAVFQQIDVEYYIESGGVTIRMFGVTEVCFSNKDRIERLPILCRTETASSHTFATSHHISSSPLRVASQNMI